MSKKMVTPSREAEGFNCVCAETAVIKEKLTAKGLKLHVKQAHRKKDVILCEKRGCFLTYYAGHVHECLPDLRRRLKKERELADGAGAGAGAGAGV